MMTSQKINYSVKCIKPKIIMGHEFFAKSRIATKCSSIYSSAYIIQVYVFLDCKC